MRMKLRRGVVATLLAGAMIFAGAAQASHHGGKMGHGSAADRAARQTEHMTQALGLSEEQARQKSTRNMRPKHRRRWKMRQVAMKGTALCAKSWASVTKNCARC